MFKYIKWELINELKNKKIILATIAIIYFCVAFIPSFDNLLMNFIVLSFTIILIGTFFLAFFYGTSRTVNSYKSQTFLLESMISLPPSKILLAKYIIAIILNLAVSIIFVTGLSIVFSKEEIILGLLKMFIDTDFETKTIIFRTFIFILSATTAFTSLAILTFITLKSLSPNSKGLRFVSLFISLFILTMISSSIADNQITNNLVYSIVMIIVSIICYLCSVWFIEHKLEIYN